MTVGFDNASHHTGDVTRLKVINRGFGSRGGDRIIGIIIGSSPLIGRAASAIILVLGWINTWAGLSGSVTPASARGGRRARRSRGAGGRRGTRRRGRGGGRITIVVGGSRRVGRRLGSKLGNSRARELVGSVAEGVDEDARVVVRIATRELDEFIGAGSSSLIAANVDLDAGGVELGTSGRVGQMKGDDLVTEEIPTTSESGRKLERVGLSVELVLLDPSTTAAALTNFVNLEPLRVSGIELVACSRAARSQVDFHRTSVMWPVLAVVGCPEYVDSASWVCGSDERGRLRAGSAGHGLVGGTLDGAGAVDLTDGRAWDRLSSGDRTLVRLAVDADRGDNTMGLDDRKKRKGNQDGEGGCEESGSLHCLNKRKVRGYGSLRENTFRGSE